MFNLLLPNTIGSIRVFRFPSVSTQSLRRGNYTHKELLGALLGKQFSYAVKTSFFDPLQLHAGENRFGGVELHAFFPRTSKGGGVDSLPATQMK